MHIYLLITLTRKKCGCVGLIPYTYNISASNFGSKIALISTYNTFQSDGAFPFTKTKWREWHLEKKEDDDFEDVEFSLKAGRKRCSVCRAHVPHKVMDCIQSAKIWRTLGVCNRLLEEKSKFGIRDLLIENPNYKSLIAIKNHFAFLLTLQRWDHWSPLTSQNRRTSLSSRPFC